MGEKGRGDRKKEPRQEGLAPTRQAAHEALFLSGSLALDLVNTEMIIRGKKRDVLTSPDVLAAWWKQAGQHHSESQSMVEATPVAWTMELLTEVKALRASLRRLANSVVQEHMVDAATLEPLNAILALGYPAMQNTEQGTIRQVMRLRDTTVGPVLLPIALSAFRLFTEGNWQRLHNCKNDRCILYFYDSTKSATRQWCSLGCMNRSRSARHYQKMKKGGDDALL